MNVTPAEPTKIVLVDDHRSFMDGLAMVVNLYKSDFEIVDMVTTVSDLLKCVGQNDVDLILLDIDLGEANGIDLLPDLLTKTSARVLILTGIHDSELHEKAILNGARGVLLKDEPATVIINAIQKVIDGEIWISHTILGKVFDQITKPSKKNEVLSSEEKKISDLTRRERQIIETLLAMETSTNEEIAGRLNISTSTLKNQLTTIYSKLEVKNRVQLMKYALVHGLAETPH